MEKSSDASYRISKRRIDASVRVQGAGELVGHFLCAEHSDTHGGAETLSDVLNEPARFVPFFPAGKKEPVFLNKQRITVVKLEGLVLLDDPAKVDAYDEARTVRVMFDDDDELVGSMRFSAPAGHRRTLDVLNEVGAFLYVEAEAAHYVVNLHHVLVASDT